MPTPAAVISRRRRAVSSVPPINTASRCRLQQAGKNEADLALPVALNAGHADDLATVDSQS